MRTNKKASEMENPAPEPRGAFEGDLLGSRVGPEDNQIETLAQDYQDYVLAEIRIAVLRLRLQTNEIIAIGLGLKSNLMSLDVAIDSLRALDAPLFVGTMPNEKGGM